jgi:hypothetical protein
VQSLHGHADVGTTMIYTHVLKVGGGAVRSPLDSLVATPTTSPPVAPSARLPQPGPFEVRQDEARYAAASRPPLRMAA